ncbi:PhoH family protein [Candidatus Woesearchaeota archaeon]|jgi:PhoH-like ATPase|nr:PhoH family protein [Candidatus Woesearchaeota archaeon]
MVKRFLLDTNVLLRDPRSLFSFEEHDIYLHGAVFKELDKFKKGNDDVNVSSREASRTLEEILDQRPTEGFDEEFVKGSIPLGEGLGNLHFVGMDIRVGKDEEADPHLLKYLSHEGQKDPNNPMVLVSNDRNLRIWARAMGHTVQSYKHDREVKSLHEFLRLNESIQLEAQNVEELRAKNSITLSKKDLTIMQPSTEEEPLSFFHNQFFHVKGDSLLIQYLDRGINAELRTLLDRSQRGAYGIRPRNKEQSYLMDLCLNDEIEIGTVLGKAGTGKTIVTLAAALQKTIKEEKYDQIVIIRPVATIGEDIGYLPGSLEAKIGPYMGSVWDAAKVIYSSSMRKKMEGFDEDGLNHLIKEGKVVLAPPTYMRGRNLAKTFIIVDEAQNLTPAQAKTLVTRTGEGSKIILSGDPYQVDLPYIDETNNGLVTTTKKLLGRDPFSTVVLKKGERSRVAELGARYL